MAGYRMAPGDGVRRLAMRATREGDPRQRDTSPPAHTRTPQGEQIIWNEFLQCQVISHLLSGNVRNWYGMGIRPLLAIPTNLTIQLLGGPHHCFFSRYDLWVQHGSINPTWIFHEFSAWFTRCPAVIWKMPIPFDVVWRLNTIAITQCCFQVPQGVLPTNKSLWRREANPPSTAHSWTSNLSAYSPSTFRGVTIIN